MEATCTCKITLREDNWIWSDCEKPKHGEGCYVVWCVKCDVWSSDCDDTWKIMREEWKS